MNVRPNIVLVHGAWADGSSWSAVVERLQADGSTVTAPQFPFYSATCWNRETERRAHCRAVMRCSNAVL